MTLLDARIVAKPWGRRDLPPPFANPSAEPIGEIWFEPPPALDALLVALAAGIAANRTLGGAVEYAQAGPADLEDVEFEGAAPLRAARFNVTLQFSAAETPLS